MAIPRFLFLYTYKFMYLLLFHSITISPYSWHAIQLLITDFDCFYAGQCDVANGGCDDGCRIVMGRVACSCNVEGKLAFDGKTCGELNRNSCDVLIKQ